MRAESHNCCPFVSPCCRRQTTSPPMSEPQMYTRDPRTWAILIPAWGSNWGSLGFSRNQNNRGSSGAYVTCMYCGLSVKTITRKKPHGARRSWTHLLCVCFCVCGRQKPEDPKIEPHGWRCHYTGRHSRSGISGQGSNYFLLHLVLWVGSSPTLEGLGRAPLVS